MYKTIATLVGGLFVGAIAMELAHRKCPERLDKLYAKAGGLASGIKDEFKQGYRSVTKSAPAEARDVVRPT